MCFNMQSRLASETAKTGSVDCIQLITLYTVCKGEIKFVVSLPPQHRKHYPEILGRPVLRLCCSVPSNYLAPTNVLTLSLRVRSLDRYLFATRLIRPNSQEFRHPCFHETTLTTKLAQDSGVEPE